MAAYLGVAFLGANALQLWGRSLCDWFFFVSVVLWVLAVVSGARIYRWATWVILGASLVLAGGLLSLSSQLTVAAPLGGVIILFFVLCGWLLVFAHCIEDMAQLRVLFVLLVISAGVNGIVALLQAVFGLSIPHTTPLWGRMTGLLRHPNELGAFCAIALPAAIALTIGAKSFWRKTLCLVGVGTILMAIVFSASVAGSVAVLAGCAVFFAAGGYIRSRKSLAWLVVAFVGFALIFWFLLVPIVRDLGTALISDRLFVYGENGIASTTLGSRLAGDREAWNLILSQPLVGRGPNTLLSSGDLVHNIFLRFWFELGLLGLLGLLTILLVTVRVAIRTRRLHASSLSADFTRLRAASLGGFTAFIVAAQAAPTSSSITAWIGVALVFALAGASGAPVTAGGIGGIAVHKARVCQIDRSRC